MRSYMFLWCSSSECFPMAPSFPCVPAVFLSPAASLGGAAAGAAGGGSAVSVDFRFAGRRSPGS